MSRAPIETILVAGDGIVGLSAALAFSRALPSVAITILPLPADPAAVADQYPATLPTIGRFHAAIGFDELDLVAKGIAVHHLGTRFEGGPAGPWTHSFGEVGRGEGAAPFHQLWLRTKQSGLALGYDRYSPASVIGGVGKFVHPSGDFASPLATYLYGLRLHPVRYRAALDAATRHLPRIKGELASVDRRDDGSIAALRLGGGGAAQADLYIDCSGPAAVLAEGLGEFEDWSKRLPALHLSAVWDENQPSPEPLDRVSEVEDGWRLTATVPGATLRAEVATTRGASSIVIRPGRRRNPFSGNMLSIGDSAVALDPLHGANLSLAHSAILRAIALFPGLDCNALELAEYNRLTALETERAGDFHALFQAQSTGFAAQSQSLARTIDQWRARGRLPFFEEETFTASSWTQMLIGLGVLPEHVAPLARAVDGEAASAAMDSLRNELEALAARLPGYAAYLAGMSRTLAKPDRR